MQLFLVQNFHQLAAAEGYHLAGLDMDGLVAGDAVDVGVIGSPNLRDRLLLLLVQTFNVEHSGLVFLGDINANGLQGFGFANTVAHFDPQSFQFGCLGSMLRGELYDILINANFH
jgi:hypothetical protein